LTLPFVRTYATLFNVLFMIGKLGFCSATEFGSLKIFSSYPVLCSDFCKILGSCTPLPTNSASSLSVGESNMTCGDKAKMCFGLRLVRVESSRITEPEL